MEKADEGRRLAVNVAASCSNAVAQAIDRMTGTEITAHDVARGQYIYGRLRRLVFGGTKNKTPIVTVVELVPRPVQKQQRLLMDILFVKEKPFLFAKFLPLDLKYARWLPSREEDAVRKQVIYVLLDGMSKGLDVTVARSDNEGAIAALMSKLNKDRRKELTLPGKRKTSSEVLQQLWSRPHVLGPR